MRFYYRLSSLSRGFVFAQFLLGLMAAAVVAGLLGYTYLSISRFSATSQLRSMSIHLLEAAAYTLAAESADADSDGFAEPPPGDATHGDGWKVPDSSRAPKTDSWGKTLKYCPWDNGARAVSSGRLSGDNPASLNSVVLAVLSSGPDKTFQTTCAQARTGAVAIGSDDVARFLNVSQMVQSAGGIPFIGDPVDDVAALEALPSSVIRKGQIRVAGANIYINMNGRAGTVASGEWAMLDGAAGEFEYVPVERPTTYVAQARAWLPPLSSAFNLTEAAVQFRVYDANGLVKDSGELPPGTRFDFRSTPEMAIGVTYYYVGRRKVSQLGSDGAVIWEEWGWPATEIFVRNAYTAREFTPPVQIGNPPAVCPAGWVGVPAMRIPSDTWGGTIDVAAFCVMAYPALASGSGAVTASSSGYGSSYYNTAPTTSVTFAQAQQYCASATSRDAAGASVSGARLMRDSEWLAIAHNLAGVGANWSDGNVGTVGGNNFMWQGWRKDDPTSSAKAASFVPADPRYRRNKTLSTGAVIYDIGGNVEQLTYVDDALGGVNGVPLIPSPGLEAAPFASGTRGMGTYPPQNSLPGTNNLYMHRGGFFYAADNAAGPFAARLDLDGSSVADYNRNGRGFRCTK